MSSTISNGTVTITPLAVNGYESARESANVIHQIVGTTTPSVTLRGTGLRHGTLECHMGADRSLTSTFEAVLSFASVLTFTSTIQPALNMQFVVTDSVEVSLDDTRSNWIVRFGYQEIS
jgi:hypothetical protein